MHIKEEVSNTLIIEKSRFIAYLNHFDNEEDYRNYLGQIRKKYYDASHVCSAFICHNIKRSSDDGEPAGTAGAPILGVLEKNNLTDTCAIVVRYFGGIKLGAGGLIRAYSSAVSEALKKGELVETYLFPKYSITLDYETSNRLRKLLENKSILLNTEYDENVTFTFVLEDKSVIENIKEITRGLEPTYIAEELIEKVL